MRPEDSQTPASGSDTAERIIDSVVNDFVEQALANQRPDVDAACARHPEHADRIRNAAACLELLADHQKSLGRQKFGRQKFGRQKFADELRGRITIAMRSTDSPALAPTLDSVKAPSAFSDTSHRQKPKDDVRIPGARYRIREVLGEGGFGVVYVAEQLEPVRRKVAIKVVKPGMDSKEVLSRFEAERQALAIMDHPNVAKVLDGGVTEDGRPYFVMELIRGIPITAFCTSQQVPLTERLRLFRDTCEAVQHAHLKGIIHRDIKPSNVLVTMRDDKPVAKVIDFGVAKALHRQLTDATIYTAFGQMIGTPIYMSPEQIQLSEQDVDTRSDIYSLGVLLYELITGETPFTRKALADKGLHFFRELVCEAEPPRPSLRVSTLRASDDPTVVDQRRFESRDLKRISGELDWICLKALAKDRLKRYQSCTEFAGDINNFLSGDAVSAKPPTLLYRISKVAKRNKVLIACGSAVVAALLLGLWTTHNQKLRAEEAEREAIAALEESDRQKLLAEERLAFAETAVDDMYVEVANKWIQSQSGMTEQQREFLEKAAEIYRQLAGTIQLESRPQKLKQAKTLRRVASIENSLGDLERSLETANQSAEILKKLRNDGGADAEITLLLAEAYYTIGHTYRANGEIKPSLEWLDKASELVLTANVAESDHDLRENLSRHARNVANFLSSYESRIAVTRELIEVSESVARDLLEADPNSPAYKRRLASALETKGISYLWWGKENEEAAKAFEKAKSVLEELRAEEPESLSHLQGLQTCTQNLSIVLGRLGRDDESAVVKQEAVEIARTLAESVPDQWRPREGLRIAIRGLALGAKQSGALERAQRLYEESYRIAQSMSRDFPQVVDARLAVPASLKDFASLEIQRGNYTRASTYFEQLTEESAAAAKLFPAERRLVQHEILARAFGAWTNTQTNQVERNLELLAPLSDCIATYHRLVEKNNGDASTAFLTTGPMCELALKSLAEAQMNLASPVSVSDEVRTRLLQLEMRLQRETIELAESWCQLADESDSAFALILRFSESYDPPAEYFYQPFDSTDFNSFADSSKALALNRFFQTLTQEMSESRDSQYQLTPGHLFVLTSAPQFAHKAALETLSNSLGNATQAERQAKAWCLYRLGKLAECSEALSDSELSTNHQNDFLRSLVASQLGDAEVAADLHQRGSQWLEANSKEIRAQRDSEHAHLQPHLAALKRLQYEAKLQLDVINPE